MVRSLSVWTRTAEERGLLGHVDLSFPFGIFTSSYSLANFLPFCVAARADTLLPQSAFRVAVNLQTLEQSLACEQLAEVRNINMPTKDVAIAFLDAYATHLEATQHLLHINSTRDLIDRVYDRLAIGQEVDPGALGLVLSICASVAYYYTAGTFGDHGIFHNHDTAHQMATLWARQGLYTMEQVHIRTMTDPTLEAVQSMVMLSFLFYHMEGFTCRARFMHSSAVTMARSLGLHKIDMPDGRPPPNKQLDIIDREVRRKVWWHVTSTDWLLSFMGGPQEGIYSIGVHNMCVNIPRNLNQQDLDTKDSSFSRPLSEPTGMAYYNQRIKLATTCREVADSLWNHIRFMDPADVNYDTVAVLDAKFDAQLKELPRFMHLNIPCSQLRTEYGELFTPSLDIQRIFIHLMINSRRCQLHMPFLIRAKTTSAFKQSRATGLHSARAVFETRRIALQDTESMGAMHLRLGGLLQVCCLRSSDPLIWLTYQKHIFYATVVLVMDLCINRDDDGATFAEVREALQILESAKDSAEMGGRFHSRLTHILRKHNVNMPTAEPELQHVHSALPGAAMGDTMPTLGFDLSTGLSMDGFELDTMWQDFLNTAPTLNAQDWDSLLSDLDMRTM